MSWMCAELASSPYQEQMLAEEWRNRTWVGETSGYASEGWSWAAEQPRPQSCALLWLMQQVAGVWTRALPTEVRCFAPLHPFFDNWNNLAFVRCVLWDPQVKCHIGAEHQCISPFTTVEGRKAQGLASDQFRSPRWNQAWRHLPPLACKPAPLLPQMLIDASQPLPHHQAPGPVSTPCLLPACWSLLIPSCLASLLHQWPLSWQTVCQYLPETPRCPDYSLLFRVWYLKKD